MKQPKGFVYNNIQAIVGCLVAVLIVLIFHILIPWSFLVGAVLTGLGVIFDRLDGGDRGDSDV